MFEPESKKVVLATKGGIVIVFTLDIQDGSLSIKQLKKIKVGPSTLSLGVTKGLAAVGRIDSNLVIIDLDTLEAISTVKYGKSML